MVGAVPMPVLEEGRRSLRAVAFSEIIVVGAGETEPVQAADQSRMVTIARVVMVPERVGVEIPEDDHGARSEEVGAEVQGPVNPPHITVPRVGTGPHRP